MSKIRPFKAVRPVRDKVHLVASRSYVSYTLGKLRDKLESNPYTFIHIIYPDFGHENKTRSGSKAKFERVKERFHEFVEEGILMRDEEPCLYVYRQSSPERSSIGIIGGVSSQEYVDGKIKVHEQTLATREKLFTNYLDTTEFNAEPVLLSYHDPEDFDNRLKQYAVDNRPEYDFTTTNRVRHELWAISDQETIEEFQGFFERLPELYIADGHHRSASSASLAQLRSDGGNLEESKAGFFMAYVMSNRQLNILNFNRLVRDLNNIRVEEFVAKLAQIGKLEVLSDPQEPSALHQFTLYIGKTWYLLTIQPEEDESPLSALDPQILFDKVLAGILGIKDPRTDRRLDYLPGDTGLMGIQASVDKGLFACGIVLYPTPFEQLQAVADAGLTMPPKSTYILPKLRSGLTIMELNK